MEPSLVEAIAREQRVNAGTEALKLSSWRHRREITRFTLSETSEESRSVSHFKQ
jgi:hypothetical protein